MALALDVSHFDLFSHHRLDFVSRLSERMNNKHWLVPGDIKHRKITPETRKTEKSGFYPQHCVETNSFGMSDVFVSTENKFLDRKQIPSEWVKYLSCYSTEWVMYLSCYSTENKKQIPSEWVMYLSCYSTENNCAVFGFVCAELPGLRGFN